MSPADIVALRPKSEGSEIASRHIGARCLGPAGGWPEGCIHEFGHGDEVPHERPGDSFLTSYVVPNLKEVQKRVDRLIAERNDLLESLRDLVASMEEAGCDDGYGDNRALERARAVIALAESR